VVHSQQDGGRVTKGYLRDVDRIPRVVLIVEINRNFGGQFVAVVVARGHRMYEDEVEEEKSVRGSIDRKMQRN